MEERIVDPVGMLQKKQDGKRPIFLKHVPENWHYETLSKHSSFERRIKLS
jgi:hypothetical protein